MMERTEDTQESLFSYNVSLDARVRKDHPLRKIKQTVNFHFIYDQVKHTYGERGHVSVPPPVILKMMLLLFLMAFHILGSFGPMRYFLRLLI